MDDFNLDRRVLSTHVRTIVMLAATLVVVGWLASPASAVKVTNDAATTADIDGTSVFWVATDGDGRPYAVIRFDLATGATSTIFTTNSRSSFIGAMRVGGGRMAIQTVSFTRTRITAVIKVINADGGGLADLVTGTFDAGNDCGEVISPLDVSSTGEVFVSTAAVNRANVACGDSTTGFVNTVTGHSVDGTTRTVFSSTGTDTGREAVRTSPYTGQVTGGNLVLGAQRTAFLIDLVTGATSVYTASLKGTFISHVSVDSAGRVVVSEIKQKSRKKTKRVGKRKRKKTIVTYSGQSRLTLFPVKGDPATKVKLFESRKSVSRGNFCGDRLIRSTGPHAPGPLGEFLLRNTEINAGGGVINELLPQTIVLSDYFFGCDATSALIDGFDRRGHSLIELVPFG